MPNRPNGLSPVSNRRKSDTPPASLPSAGGTVLRAEPPSLGRAGWGSPTFAKSKPRRGPFATSG
eukprot:4973406-Alexandrium_andersonii.AAC.1